MIKNYGNVPLFIGLGGGVEKMTLLFREIKLLYLCSLLMF